MTQSHTTRDTVIHLVAGGIAGTAGAIVTCPLEVVKTRLQSSQSGFHMYKMNVPPIASTEGAKSQVTCKSIMSDQRRKLNTISPKHSAQLFALTHCSGVSRNANVNSSAGLIQCIKYIMEFEGPGALFKGLGPNLVGVAPSRAIYFCSYSQSKQFFNSFLRPDTPIVHICSAACAGFTAATATNPIWFVKTRLQLHHNKNLTASECIQRIYKTQGIRGFYKGITASYFGISETVVHFVIYESIKAKLNARRMASSTSDNDSKSSQDFLEFMVAGGVSKTVASCIAYPHEVARTRLREEGTKYRSFFQTLATVYHEEGHRGLYRGLSTQLIRQIPNTAIMMATYEAVVYFLTSYFDAKDSNFYQEDET
ncbi:unnamed protein product [Bemisia tabaci]|uniref:Mitochondrial carrier protein n=1 Tax=Bemisia tabaci TaxID=7038 RepID=A0A9P0AJ91_BEMTA|nr:unnamed protein product [Bemisia tabaci]